ncbi:unnamed protein product [Mytilus edulis]|uniref:J domain-containing protein n=1 Tax=Mytilus edulis TaxID=6550 RepID=A0A8S3R754_MYTED|nr:unnamed protein product [Mytilus edulis]
MFMFTIVLFLLLVKCHGEENYFKVLGITRTASKREIKSAYRAISKRIHPDKNQCDEFAAEKFIKLTHAYTILLDDASRSRYKKRNPSFGREKEEYDWNIPVSTTGTFDAVNVWIITLRSKVYLLGSKLYILGSEVFTLRTKVFTSSENLIRGFFNIKLLVGFLLYLTSNFLSRNLLFQFILTFLLAVISVHFFLMRLFSTTFYKLLSWFKMEHEEWITTHKVSPDWFIFYMLLSFAAAMRYFFKYQLHKNVRYVSWYNVIQKLIGLLVASYSVKDNPDVALVQCFIIILVSWIFLTAFEKKQ